MKPSTCSWLVIFLFTALIIMDFGCGASQDAPLRGPRAFVNLRDAEHLTPSDAVWLAPGTIKTGSMGTEKTVSAIRDYVAAFLDTNLRGRPADPLLTRDSANYLDAVVMPANGVSCREP